MIIKALIERKIAMEFEYEFYRFLIRDIKNVLNEEQLIVLFYVQAEFRLKYGSLFWGFFSEFKDSSAKIKKFAICKWSSDD